jgi:16S rRNA (cytosine967-C5)-methyltransferase
MLQSSHVLAAPADAGLPLSPPMSTILAAAAAALAQVIDGGTPDASLQTLASAVRPGAMDLSYNALRDFGRGDFLLSKLMEKPPGDVLVRSLLLVALSRLERRPDEAHTIVNQATTAASTMGNGRFKGLVNGVLRNFLRRKAALLKAADADNVASARYPTWWIARLRADYPDRWQEISTQGNTHPPMCLRFNQRRMTGTNWQLALHEAGIITRQLGNEALLLDRPVPVERIPGFATGICSVQDFGAQAAAHLLDVTDSMKVLDACAAPGGKSAHLLELAAIDLLALDHDARRLSRIESNLARLGLSAKLSQGDAARPERWWCGVPFDRILADVPCTASGVIRRHPDAKWLRRESDVAKFAKQQAKIIDALWQTLARGGKMLYATCSVFRQENELQILNFVGRHADAIRLPTKMINSSLESIATTANAPNTNDLELRLLPTAEHDGFYYALLQKR